MVWISAINSDSSVTVVGDLKEMEDLIETSNGKALRMKVPLHCPLMRELREDYSLLIDQFDLKDPKVPILSYVNLDRMITCE